MKKMLIVLLGLMVLSGVSAFGQSITLDQVVAETASPTSTDSLKTGQEVVFYIRFTNSTTEAISGTTNGFRFYSENGAEWSDVSGDTLGTLTKTMMDGGLFIDDTTRVTGNASDTVGFSTFKMFGSGMAVGFDDRVITLTIGPLDISNHGKTICLDSSYYPPSGLWKWATSVDYFPTWDGPHCYTIIDPLNISDRPGSGLPEAWSLGQNYPNPFNSSTQIQFDVKSRANVSLVVYNVLGQQVATLVDETMAAGSYTVDWDGYSDGGSSVSSGIYFYRLQTDNFVDTKKMVLMK
ncbi:MAG TPA: T9SS type A sorting domain-containing protein [candidate division Zixibacteria bacterium]|nr:T9SS type A sorting domain-containing protein [candidate division Zixibacteria bacterium]